MQIVLVSSVFVITATETYGIIIHPVYLSICLSCFWRSEMIPYLLKSCLWLCLPSVVVTICKYGSETCFLPITRVNSNNGGIGSFRDVGFWLILDVAHHRKGLTVLRLFAMKACSLMLVMKEEIRCPRREICPGFPLSTTNLTWTGLTSTVDGSVC